MKPLDYSAWFTIGLDSWSLGVEASAVMSLRAAKMTGGGPAASREAFAMVSEKWAAAAELQTEMLLRGSNNPIVTTQRALKHYRRKVAANRRRLG